MILHDITYNSKKKILFFKIEIYIIQNSKKEILFLCKNGNFII